MNIQTFEGNALDVEVGRYFTIQRTGYKIFIVTFDSREELDSYIENVCVSMGEDGEKDNIIYQSEYSQEVLK